MPAYKNRRPMPGDASVWRYLSLSAVIATIQKRQLRLTRVDKFQDPFEGSVPQQDIDNQELLFRGAASAQAMMNSVSAWYPQARHAWATFEQPGEDPWCRVTRLRRAKTRSAHASCWSMGDESEPLWRAFCDDGRRGVGVALRTTLDRLKASVEAHDLYVSPINYRQYHEGPAFTDEMDPLLHKRLAFKAEYELRLLKFDQAHYSALVPKDASVPELPEHICVDWVLGDVIEKIVVSPYADENYERLVRLAVGAADPSIAVELSELHERRDHARF
jgi:hypothetical protein